MKKSSLKSILFTSLSENLEQPNLIERYKVKNPYTWNEIQAEKGGTEYSLLYTLKGFEHWFSSHENREQIIKEMGEI